MKVVRRYGWKRDRPDPRDRRLQLLPPQPFPDVLDYRASHLMPPIWFQDQLGACTAFALLRCYQWSHRWQESSSENEDLSKLFLYWCERRREGTLDEDGGASLRTGCKVLNSEGVCLEDLWPYDISKWNVEPPSECFAEAQKHQAIDYFQVPQTLVGIKQALMQDFLVACGLRIHENFESEDVTKTGVVPMPAGRFVGGHAVTVCGWDQPRQVFILANSWGTNWGMDGFFTVPMDYLLSPSFASNFWVMRKVE